MEQHRSRTVIGSLRRCVGAVADAKEHTGEGLHPYVSIKGRARITEGGALEVMDGLAPNYFGPGAVYPMREVPPGVVIHVTVDEIRGMGPWRQGG